MESTEHNKCMNFISGLNYGAVHIMQSLKIRFQHLSFKNTTTEHVDDLEIYLKFAKTATDCVKTFLLSIKL